MFCKREANDHTTGTQCCLTDTPIFCFALSNSDGVSSAPGDTRCTIPVSPKLTFSQVLAALVCIYPDKNSCRAVVFTWVAVPPPGDIWQWWRHFWLTL